MKKIYLLIILTIVFVCIFLFNNLKEEKNIKIGFVGALTGKYSVLGNAMVNGVLLAFEENNYEINGRKVELIFKDDKQNEELNKQIINAFVEDDIKIVIGNVTSSMSKVSMSIINKFDDMFMISASSASNEFAGIDDNFFRVHVANNTQRFDSFSNYIIKNNYKKIYGIYDPNNKTYSMDYLINLEKALVLKKENPFINYVSSNDDLTKLIENLKKVKPDLILICANSVDTARLVQYFRLKGLNIPIASSEWAMTPSFLENAGKSSEGLIFNIDYDAKANSLKYKTFVKKYLDKYGIYPSMFASKAYELSNIIIEVLKEGKETQIKENILAKKEFDGLQGKIVFDKYGDVSRTFNTFIVINGEFKKVDD